MAGKGDELKGKAKQAAGDLTDDEDLHREGRTDETAGKAKGKVDKLGDKARDAIDSVKEKFS